MAILPLALKSLLNRRYTALLIVFSIALSVALLLSVERLRSESHNSFANTLSGADLVVGARSGAINLMLYAIFHIGDATHNLSWRGFEHFAQHPLVDWSIPLVLGDSHKGYRVLGTNDDYFRHYRYANKRNLTFSAGRPFDSLFEAVLGAEVAKKLGYRLEQTMVLSHGSGKVSFVHHDDHPFRVVGILQPTGTPVDRTVHVPLQGIEAIHAMGSHHHTEPHTGPAEHDVDEAAPMPEEITAFILGLKSRVTSLRLQREINDYRGEPLLAILPGLTLQQLWDLMGVAENALLIISAMVVFVGLTGMLTVLLAGLNERRREMSILRSVGARPVHILLLVTGESLLLSLLGILFGLCLLYLGLLTMRPLLESNYGLFLAIHLPAYKEWILIMLIALAGLLVGLIPGYRAYRYSLTDGMNIRI